MAIREQALASIRGLPVDATMPTTTGTGSDDTPLTPSRKRSFGKTRDDDDFSFKDLMSFARLSAEKVIEMPAHPCIHTKESRRQNIAKLSWKLSLG